MFQITVNAIVHLFTNIKLDEYNGNSFIAVNSHYK